MSRLVKQWIPAFIALIVALIVLLGQPAEWRDTLIMWTVIVAAFAFLLGLFNIVRVHVNKMRQPGQGGLYSLVFLLAVVISLGVSAIYGPQGETTVHMFNLIIAPVGASLAALMVFTLTLAAFRLLRTRRDERLKAIVFILVVAVVLAGGSLQIEPLLRIRRILVNVLGMAGTRGLLLGVALGTVISAIRALWPKSEA